jgi:hypothetical protein
MGGADVEEVNVQSIDLGHELRHAFSAASHLRQS